MQKFYYQDSYSANNLDPIIKKKKKQLTSYTISIKKSVLTDKSTGLQYLLIQQEFLLAGDTFSNVRKKSAK